MQHFYQLLYVVLDVIYGWSSDVKIVMTSKVYSDNSSETSDGTLFHE